jgi:hypothetical protein
MDAEADYVELFDRGRGTSLHLFEHVHGDSRDRGPAMIDLAQTYEQAGLFLAEGELPDYLPVVLEYASTQPPREARAFLGEMAHILNAIFSALQQAREPLCQRAGALLDLAGEKAQAVPRCPRRARSTRAGPSRRLRRLLHQGPGPPGQPQPIRSSATGPPHRSVAHERHLHNFLFNVYPYICLAVFLMGSLARFDRDQYTWKSDSRRCCAPARCAGAATCSTSASCSCSSATCSGLLTPHCGVRDLHQRAAEAADGGGRRRHRRVICFIGLSCCCTGAVRPAHPADQPPHRHRDPDDPVGAAGDRPDHAAVSLQPCPTASVMLMLADWAQRIVTFRPVDATAWSALPWPYKDPHVCWA